MAARPRDRRKRGLRQWLDRVICVRVRSCEARSLVLFEIQNRRLGAVSSTERKLRHVGKGRQARATPDAMGNKDDLLPHYLARAKLKRPRAAVYPLAGGRTTLAQALHAIQGAAPMPKDFLLFDAE